MDNREEDSTTRLLTAYLNLLDIMIDENPLITRAPVMLSPGSVCNLWQEIALDAEMLYQLEARDAGAARARRERVSYILRSYRSNSRYT